MRQRFLNLTSDGEKALAVAIPLWRNIQQRFVDQIGDAQWRTLRAQLEGLSKIGCLYGRKLEIIGFFLCSRRLFPKFPGIFRKKCVHRPFRPSQQLRN